MRWMITCAIMRVTAHVYNAAQVESLCLELQLVMFAVAHEAIDEAKVNQTGLVVALEHDLGCSDVAMSVSVRMYVL